MHYSVPAPHRFDLNSDNDVWFMCDELTRRHGIENITTFKESQQIFGIKFDPHALPFDIELRQIYKPVSSVYWDWMHVYLTSSGLMQYHLNEMFLDIQSEGVTLSALDQMMAVFVRSNRTQLRQLSENYIQKQANSIKMVVQNITQSNALFVSTVINWLPNIKKMLSFKIIREI